MERLEKRLIELLPETRDRISAADLYVRGYEPKHRTMRKRVGDVEICYRESSGGLFEFAAIIRITPE